MSEVGAVIAAEDFETWNNRDVSEVGVETTVNLLRIVVIFFSADNTHCRYSILICSSIFNFDTSGRCGCHSFRPSSLERD